MSDWFYGSMKSAFENGLMNGMSGSDFAPNDDVTRVTALYRMKGGP